MKDALDVVNAYYEACNNEGDLSEVPLADDVGTARGVHRRVQELRRRV